MPRCSVHSCGAAFDLMTSDTANAGNFCPRAAAIELPETLGSAVFKRSGASGVAVLGACALSWLA